MLRNTKGYKHTRTDYPSNFAVVEPTWRARPHYFDVFNGYIKPEQVLGAAGIPLGRNLFGPTVWDPFEQRAQRKIAVLFFLILGEIGSGKTTLGKVFTMRLGSFVDRKGRPLRIAIDDYKNNEGEREYARMVRKAFGTTENDLSQASWNIFHEDLQMELDEVLANLYMFVQHLREYQSSSLDDIDRKVLETVLRMMMSGDFGPSNLDNLLSILNYERGELKLVRRGYDDRPLRVDSDRVAASAEGLFLTLERLMGGEFGGMFTGTRSPIEDMSKPVVANDFFSVDEEAMNLLQAFIWRVRASALVRMDERIRIDIFTGDENASSWEIPVYANAMYNYIKKLRMLGGMIMLISQYMSDYFAIGSKKAENMVRHANLFIGQQPDDELGVLQDKLRLEDRWCDIINQFDEGEFMYLQRGHPPQLVRLDLTDFEKDVCKSDQAAEAMIHEGI